MVLKSGSVRNLEIQMQTKDGGLLDCLVSAETVTIHDQLCVLSVMQDITARKRSEAELFGAIEAVMKDTSWFSRTVIEKLVAIRTPGQAEKSSAGVTDLTARERDVLALMCLGLADKQAAAALGLSLNTARNHVAAIYRKIDVRRRTAAINWARKRGFAAEETAKAAGTGPSTRKRTRRFGANASVGREGPRPLSAPVGAITRCSTPEPSRRRGPPSKRRTVLNDDDVARAAER